VCTCVVRVYIQIMLGHTIPLKCTLCYHMEGGTKKKGTKKKAAQAGGLTLGGRVLNQDILKINAECKRYINGGTGKTT